MILSIFLTIMVAIFVFLIIYMTNFHITKSEKFNTNVSDALEQIYGEININVDDFNKTNKNVNNAIDSAFNIVYQEIDSVEVKNLKANIDVLNKMSDQNTNIGNLKNEFLTRSNLDPYELTTEVNTKLMLNQNLVANNYVTKNDADLKYATSKDVIQVLTDMKNNDLRIDNISKETNDVNKLLRYEYASVEWCNNEFATKTELDFAKTIQDNMSKKYTIDAELTTYKDKTKQDILDLKDGISNYKTYSDNTYATQTNLKDEINTYTPLEMHNKVSDTVNNTLVTLNTALLKTIENNADAATFAKIQQYEDSIQGATNTVNEMRKQMDGITANSIARNELTLGNFKLSGVEQDNTYIKVFNKEGTQLSGGIMLANLDTNNINVNSSASFDGQMKLGKENKPMFIAGSADVDLKQGNVILGDVKARHKINGTLDVNNIMTQNIQVGNRKLDIGDLVQQIKNLDNRISNIENDH